MSTFQSSCMVYSFNQPYPGRVLFFYIEEDYQESPDVHGGCPKTWCWITKHKSETLKSCMASNCGLGSWNQLFCNRKIFSVLGCPAFSTGFPQDLNQQYAAFRAGVGIFALQQSFGLFQGKNVPFPWFYWIKECLFGLNEGLSFIFLLLCLWCLK